MDISITDVGMMRKFDVSSKGASDMSSNLPYLYEGDAGLLFYPDAYMVNITLVDVVGQNTLNSYYNDMNGPKELAVGAKIERSNDVLKGSMSLVGDIAKDAMDSGVDAVKKLF
jgi:hypothetical protein